MIDLHSHFLYGVDDGPADIEGSFELLKQAEQVGISKILATPHFTDRSTRQDQHTIHAVFTEIKNRLAAEQQLHIDIQLAAEVYYSPEMVKWADQSWLLIGRGQSYMLFDIPMQFLPPDLPEIIFQLGRRKIIPIMAHPERNSEVQKEPQLLAEWIRLGCIMQMDAGSITGKFGQNCQHISRRLVRHGYIHLIASDAHDCVQRNFHLLTQAYSVVGKKYGQKWAQRLFIDNPQRILAGEQPIRPLFAAPPARVNFLQKISAKFKPGAGGM